MSYSMDRGGMADCFVDLVGLDKYMWVPGHDVWYRWNDKFWVEDRTFNLQNDIQIFMVYVSRVMAEYESSCQFFKQTNEANKAKEYAKLCKRSPSSILGIEELAKMKVSVEPDNLNSQNVLNFQNGTLEFGNLKSSDFIFREHRKEDLITHCLGFDYNPEATSPRFDQFRKEVIVKAPPVDDPDFTSWEYDEDADKRLFEIIATGLTSSAKWQTCAWLQGDGGNGKSVLIELLAYMMSDLAAPFDFDILSRENPGYSIAQVQGKRMLFSSESEENSKLAAKTMKAMIDGSTLNARPIYGSPYIYTGFFTIIWAMNHKPKIMSTKNDVWRRLSVHPFNRIFSDKEKDVELLDKLKAEAAGVMNYLIDSLKRLIDNGHKFTYSDTCQTAKDEYKQENNPILQWKNDCTEEPDDKKEWLSATKLFEHYQKWCELENRKHVATATKFGLTLKDSGVISSRTEKGNVYCLKINDYGQKLFGNTWSKGVAW